MGGNSVTNFTAASPDFLCPVCIMTHDSSVGLRSHKRFLSQELLENVVVGYEGRRSVHVRLVLG